MRSACALAVVLFALVLGGSARGAGGGLVVAIRGGDLGNFYIKTLGPMFEKQFGVHVTFTVDTSGPALAKVRAEASNPQTDVLWTVATTQFEGERLGLFAKMDFRKIPNAKAVDPSLRDPESYYVAKSIENVGIGYNADIFAQHHLAPPTSWRDLFRPEFRGHLGIEAPSDSIGQATIAGLAALTEGGENDRAAGKVLDRLLGAKSDILWATSPSHMIQLLTQQDVWISAFADARVWEMIDKGAPMRFVVPREGTFPNPSYWTLVKGGPNPDAAYQWINWELSPQIQELEADQAGRFPVNRDAFALIRAQGSPKARERMGSIHVAAIDWKWINDSYPGWVRRLELGR